MEAWVTGLARATAMFPIVLAPLGHLFEPYRLSLSSFRGELVTAAEYMDAPISAGEVWLVRDAESVAHEPHNSLGQMRSRAMEGADAQERLVLVSRWPRSRYPSVPGSSLIEDAKVYRPNLLAPGSQGPESVIPLLRDARLDLREEWTRALLELGEGLLAALDHALFEVGATRAEDVITHLGPGERKELAIAGFLREGAQSHSWAVVNRNVELKDAVSAAICSLTKAGATAPSVFAELFSQERLIRRAIRRKARDVWGDGWRKSVLPGDLAPRVLGRAQDDIYPGARSVAELRDPLEWLTFPELMQVRERPEIGGLGLSDGMWRRLGKDVGPIRNRLAHMRLLRSEDLDVIRQWHRICIDRLAV